MKSRLKYVRNPDGGSLPVQLARPFVGQGRRGVLRGQGHQHHPRHRPHPRGHFRKSGQISERRVDRFLPKGHASASSKPEVVNRISIVSRGFWFNDCRIRQIGDLSAVKNLTVLYLYSNRIEKIERIDPLVNLKMLYLQRNKIR